MLCDKCKRECKTDLILIGIRHLHSHDSHKVFLCHKCFDRLNNLLEGVKYNESDSQVLLFPEHIQ